MLVIRARLLLVDPPTNIAVKLAESLHSLASAVGIFHSHARLVKFSFPNSMIIAMGMMAEPRPQILHVYRSAAHDVQHAFFCIANASSFSTTCLAFAFSCALACKPRFSLLP